MDISAYLNRIGYEGDLTPTPETLAKLHRAHLYAIPYENLDIHLGRTLSLDVERIYEKIVTRGRGGWCYEMNGLFAWALDQLGFSVTRLASAVNREASGDKAERNHLILMAELDRPYLVDVGFGNGIVEPLPLEVGVYSQGFLSYRLSHDNDRWHFHNQPDGGPGFDFTLEAYQMPDFAEKCHELQTSPESGFVRATVCQRHIPDGIVSLRGAVQKTITQQEVREQIIESRDAYDAALREQFDLHLPDDEIDTLWQKVWERHQVWLQQQAEASRT